MSNNGSSGSAGPSIPTILLVVFIVLKLCHVIDWSWWWVLSPLWIPAGIAVGGLLIWGGWLLVRHWLAYRSCMKTLRRMQRETP